MRTEDATAVARRGADSLVRVAGTAVALTAKDMLGSCYARRVAVVVGPGLNGADGRVAAGWLSTRGAKVDVIEVQHQPALLRGYDLVIDAAFGLGCSRPYVAPEITSGTKVLAVDLVSGVDADTGDILGSPLSADVTLALGALKYAHLTGPSAALMGTLRFAGLDIVSSYRDGLMEDRDLVGMVVHEHDDHKWSHAVSALCGSPLMPGAADLVVRGAIAGGASMVRLESNGMIGDLVRLPSEVVRVDDALVDPRSKVVVAGPGLGRDATQWLRSRLDQVRAPVILDADGLHQELFLQRDRDRAPWLLTPHEGEFQRITHSSVPANRIDAVRSLAQESGCVVLLKGPITLLCDPNGTLRVVNSGTPALATAGSGDVLAGLISGAVARGHDVLSAGALSAHLHGRAAARLAPYAPASALLVEIPKILEGVSELA
ncbi:MAG: NAD(P)H-hydrate dehydratase [Acidobacteria bacterium]|nr:NAD(P)H-hydrate dehydratase [Acidobacteriota bacterium]